MPYSVRSRQQVQQLQSKPQGNDLSLCVQAAVVLLVQNAQQGLLGALRREEQAVKQAQRLQAELAALQDLLTANQKELQRNQMVMKFRNAEVERRRVCQHYIC